MKILKNGAIPQANIIENLCNPYTSSIVKESVGLINAPLASLVTLPVVPVVPVLVLFPVYRYYTPPFVSLYPMYMSEPFITVVPIPIAAYPL